MQKFILNDVCCPARSSGNLCCGQLSLDEGVVDVIYTSGNTNEIIEGILRCHKCNALYPILCGLPILVGQPWLYVRDNYTIILSLAAEVGFSISQPMIAVLHKQEANQGQGIKGNKYDTPATINANLARHYDNVWDILPSDHPLRQLINDHYRQDFYTVALQLLTPFLNSDQKVLDIGCGVGRGVHELAKHCGLVYGVELAYGSAFAARRMLRHFPNRLNEYWLKWEGDNRQRRSLSDWQRNNVEIIVASGDNLPFPTANIDIANSWNVIDRVPNPTKLLNEKKRVLKSGGIFSFADPYSWGDNTPREQWMGGRDGVRSVDVVRDWVQESSDILQEKMYMPWLYWAYERDFTLFMNHCIVARKR